MLTFSDVKRLTSLSDAFGGGARDGGAGLDSSFGGGAGAWSEVRKESKVARLAEDSDELLESILASSSSSASVVLGRFMALVSSIDRLLFAIDARRWSDLSFLPLMALARRFIFFRISSIKERGSSETGA